MTTRTLEELEFDLEKAMDAMCHANESNEPSSIVAAFQEKVDTIEMELEGSHHNSKEGEMPKVTVK